MQEVENDNKFPQHIKDQIIANASKGERTIVTQLDNGHAVTYVPLDDSEDPLYAIVDTVTFDALCERGVSPKWSLHKSSGKPIVWSPKTGKMIFVARLAANCDNDQIVTCVSGSNLDLRQRNLLVETVKKTKDRDNFEPGLGRTQLVKFIDARTFGLRSNEQYSQDQAKAMVAEHVRRTA